MKTFNIYLLALSLFMLSGCSYKSLEDELIRPELANQTVLYAGFYGKTPPFIPNEIIPAPKSTAAYMEAQYNELGQLVILKKHYADDVDFTQTIEYEGGYVKRVKLTRLEGPSFERTFENATNK